MTPGSNRPLSTVERKILDLLLEPDFEGASAFRSQLAYAVAVESDGAEPSITLEIDSAAPHSSFVELGPLPYEGRVKADGDEPVDEILVYAKDGYLSTLEYVDTWRRGIVSWPDFERISVLRPRN